MTIINARQDSPRSDDAKLKNPLQKGRRIGGLVEREYKSAAARFFSTAAVVRQTREAQIDAVSRPSEPSATG